MEATDSRDDDNRQVSRRTVLKGGAALVTAAALVGGGAQLAAAYHGEDHCRYLYECDSYFWCDDGGNCFWCTDYCDLITGEYCPPTHCEQV